MNKDKNMYQTIILTCDDGSRILFSGPAQVFPDDERKVVNIKITEPYPLPEGMKFESLDDLLNEKDKKAGIDD